MRKDGIRRINIIIALIIVLLSVFLIVPAQSDYPGNYICIGNCDTPVTPPETPTANQPPIFEPVQAQTVSEGSLLAFFVNASDPDQNILAFTAFIPPGAEVTLEGGNLYFSWIPDYSQAGSYSANFTVMDDEGLSDSLNISINVLNINRPPVLIPIGSKTGAEGVLVSFGIYVSDPDGGSLAFTHSSLPTGSSFVPDGGGNYSFSWTPSYGQAGTYYVNFTVVDSEGLYDYENVRIDVAHIDRPPALDYIGNRTISEGLPLIFRVNASDPDGDTLEFAVLGLPRDAAYTEYGSNQYRFVWTPDYDQSGVYHLNFTVTDGLLMDYETVMVTVLNTNRAPVLTQIGDKIVKENSSLNFDVNATDPDGDVLVFSAKPLPSGALFVNQTLSWTPDFNQTGMYMINVTVIDNGGLIDYEKINITVSNTNRPPVMLAIGNKTVAENATLLIPVNAIDPDGGTLMFTSGTLPVGAQYKPDGKGNYTFTWTPGYNQSGIYQVYFAVTDGDLGDSENITINVTNTNRAPFIESLANISVGEGWSFMFPVNVTDPDGDNVTVTATIPAGALFTKTGDTYTFQWTAGTAGNYSANFTAVDSGGLATTRLVTILVMKASSLTSPAVNQPPSFTDIGPKSVWETYIISFTVQAQDPNGDPLTITSSIPSGAAFSKTGTNTYLFSWTPPYGQTGMFWANFTVTDGHNLLDILNIPITVTDEPFPSCDCGFA